jgi:hypothetical protein
VISKSPNGPNGHIGQTPPPDTGAAVAALARELEGLRRIVDQLLLLPGRVDEVAGLVARLTETTAQQRPIPAPPPPAGEVSWLDLPPDVDEAELTLSSLVDWMLVVYLRYSDAARTLPACWLWHPDVVEELLWLRAAWLTAYSVIAPLSAPGDWHDRQRPGVVRRIRDYAGMCSLENHQLGAESHGPAPAVPAADAAGPIACWWSTNRTGAPPAPTAAQLAAAAAPRDGRGRVRAQGENR